MGYQVDEQPEPTPTGQLTRPLCMDCGRDSVPVVARGLCQRCYAELETQYNALRQIFDREPTQNIEELRHNAAGILDHIDDPTATIAAFRGGEGEE